MKRHLLFGAAFLLIVRMSCSAAEPAEDVFTQIANTSDDATIRSLASQLDDEALARLAITSKHMNTLIQPILNERNYLLRYWARDNITETRLKGHEDMVTRIAFSPDGKLLASGSRDSTIRLWDLQSGQEKKKLSDGSRFRSVQALAFSPDGKLLVAGGPGLNINIWDIETGTIKTTLSDQPDDITSLAFLPNGLLAVSYLATTIPIKLWDISTASEKTDLQGHTDTVNSLDISPYSILASGSSDKTIKLWNITTAAEINTLLGHTDEVGSVKFSPDGNVLASGSADSTIRFWDVQTGKQTGLINANDYKFSSLAFSPDGRLLASATLDGIKIWIVKNKNQINLINHHGSLIAFSPDGKTLAVDSLNDIILIRTR